MKIIIHIDREELLSEKERKLIAAQVKAIEATLDLLELPYYTEGVPYEQPNPNN